ncbi:MAG: GNAT family N-acetyltransferase [Bacillota bacterium]
MLLPCVGRWPKISVRARPTGYWPSLRAGGSSWPAAAGGYLVYHTGEPGFIQQFYVTPTARGRGLGRVLFRTALAELAATGHASACLGCSAASVPAIALYQARGFTVEREIWRRSLRWSELERRI